MSDAPLRVAVWGTGNIGERALREVIRHPDLELVGVVVYREAKDGVDAGTLCGEAPTGVIATTDRTAVAALRPDCAVYMPSAADLGETIELLAQGTNIVTTCGMFQAGAADLEPGDRERVLEACTLGSASVYATGSSPGFITDALPLALLSLQRRVDLIEIEEYANLAERDSPQLLFELMGFGAPIAAVDPGRAWYLKGAFGASLARLAVAAGRPVDEWSAKGEVAAAVETEQLAAGRLDAGTVGAQRTIISGSSDGREIVRFTANWYCTTSLDPDWDLLPTGWRVRTHGDAPLNVTLEFPFAVEELGANTPGYTANRPVNAIPFVCAAEPGILLSEDLPPIVPAGPR
jgi:4-hydroxy-tetrahydrodipicolinate reductase